MNGTHESLEFWWSMLDQPEWRDHLAAAPLQPRTAPSRAPGVAPSVCSPVVVSAPSMENEVVRSPYGRIATMIAVCDGAALQFP